MYQTLGATHRVPLDLLTSLLRGLRDARSIFSSTVKSRISSQRNFKTLVENLDCEVIVEQSIRWPVLHPIKAVMLPYSVGEVRSANDVHIRPIF